MKNTLQTFSAGRLNVREIWSIVKLRWALTISTINKSAFQAILFVLGCIWSVALVVGVWVGSFFLARGIEPTDSELSQITSVIAGIWTLGVVFVVLGQLVAFGQGGVSARQLYRSGVPRANIRWSLIVSQMLTPSGVAIYLSLLAVLGFLSQRFVNGIFAGIGIWIICAICAALTIFFAAALSQTIATLAMVIIRNKSARNAVTVVFVFAIIILSQSSSFIGGYMGSQVGDRIDNPGANSVQTMNFGWFGTVGVFLSWLPIANMVALPFKLVVANSMSALFVVISIVVFAATVALLMWCFDWAMHRDIVAGPNIEETSTAKPRGLGIFNSASVRSPFSAIIARMATSWVRDVRYSMSLILPVLFVAIFAFQGFTTGDMHVMIAAVPLSGYFMCLMGLNMLAYDGTAFIMHTYSGVKGRVDWFARSTFQLFVALVMQILVNVIVLAVPGVVPQMDIFWALTVLSVCFILGGIGLTPVLSSLLLYPVPSADQPIRSPQGRTGVQMFVPLIQMISIFVLFIPGALTVWICMATGNSVRMVITTALIVQLIVSVLYFIGGNMLGGYILDKRRLKIHTTLREFAQLMR
ncbi:hypothetical protein EJ419_00830 [Alloscardovia theropitheci]|uniref:Uncharacterized protein n=1 Tax=Alloscardovia theropitheci TaxID=2496842 RepID=A0A4R0QTU5_9BIFI|nr:hypothetical protein [Alloscardovia theropitheci]TCD54968.1 hypothetical protein EJ419_00830 [Alloscardovia theropitheci]